MKVLSYLIAVIVEALFLLRFNSCSELLSKELLALNGFSEIVLLPQVVIGIQLHVTVSTYFEPALFDGFIY